MIPCHSATRGAHWMGNSRMNRIIQILVWFLPILTRITLSVHYDTYRNIHVSVGKSGVSLIFFVKCYEIFINFRIFHVFLGNVKKCSWHCGNSSFWRESPCQCIMTHSAKFMFVWKIWWIFMFLWEISWNSHEFLGIFMFSWEISRNSHEISGISGLF